jgi:cobalt-zinc-cadmium efflux system membrane fusion protein
MIHAGDPVQILIDAYPDRVFTGVVNRIAGGVDPMTRTVQVEVDIANPQHLLRPGMYATTRLSAGTRQALVVPLSAVQTLGTQHYVWLVDNGKVSQQYVNVGQATGESVEITGGLQPTDTIVVGGADLVRQGQQVRTSPAVSPGTP